MKPDGNVGPAWERRGETLRHRRPSARAAFTEADAGQALILIPPIVAVEMIYLGEKGCIPAHHYG